MRSLGSANRRFCGPRPFCRPLESWHATLDGREVPVLRANQIFRAVYAEPGQHVITYRYRQRGLLAGMLITAITALVLVGL